MPEIRFENKVFAADKFPEICPWCGRHVGLEQLLHEMYRDTKRDFMVVNRCPRIECRALSVAVYAIEANSRAALRKVVPILAVSYTAPDAINAFSPKFGPIYEQALQAEAFGLDEATGPCARKALEFLVKDYAKHRATAAAAGADVSKEHAAIEKDPLAKVIKGYVSSPLVQQVAQRAAWLGNDEVHYVKVWTSKDIEDLKHVISITVNFLNHELEAEALIASMPAP